MQENRNATLGARGNSRGTVCIDTKRVLDCCRDRDCFEEARVYLTPAAEEVLAAATNVRTRSAKLLWAYVGVNEVPFNCGFYQIVVRYYISIEFEACLGVGRSQCFNGIAAVEKEVVLYGGEGKATTFTSGPANTYCNMGDLTTAGTNEPIAVVETVEPVILGTKVVECGCPCPCGEYIDLPENVRCCVDGEIITNTDGPRIYVSIGIFSVVRIERPAQLLVEATDYSVPDKECPCVTNDNPCALFQNIAFPVAQFKGTECCTDDTRNTSKGGCGCGNKN